MMSESKDNGNTANNTKTMEHWIVESILCEDMVRQAELMDKAIESGIKEGVITGIANWPKPSEKEKKRLSVISKQDNIDTEKIRKILAARGIEMPDIYSTTDDQRIARIKVTYASSLQEKEEAFRKLFDTYNLGVGKELTVEELSTLMEGQNDYFDKKAKFE